MKRTVSQKVLYLRIDDPLPSQVLNRRAFKVKLTCSDWKGTKQIVKLFLIPRRATTLVSVSSQPYSPACGF